MLSRRKLVLYGALLTLAAAPSAAIAAGTSVTVRVEGGSRTLLAPTRVHTHTGWITKGGTPKGKCPATSAAGAFDSATHHRWAGKYFASVGGIFITSIFGEKPSGSLYWEVFLNNRATNLGICALKLHRGDQVLLAVDNGKELPLVLRGPRQVRVGSTLALTVLYYDARGKARALRGVRVHGGGQSAVSDSAGVVRFHVAHAGRLTLHADHAGYIRAAALHVTELP